MMTWLPVLTDCHGNPEVVVGYAVLLMAVWVAGWYECELAPGVIAQCPIYARSPWLEVAFTEGTSFDMMSQPDPPLGGVDIYRVAAIDHAGNFSEDTCP